MTTNDCVNLILDRVGLSSQVARYRGQALRYLNAAMHDMEARPAGGWWFLRQRSTFKTTHGTRYYALSTKVLYVTLVRDTTNNRLLETTTMEAVTANDPDLDEEGDARYWYNYGADATTGATQIGLYPIPSTTDDVMGYEYYGYLADLLDDDDYTHDFFTSYGIPQVLHPAIWNGAAKLYLEETGDMEGAAICSGEAERSIKFGLRVNERQRGNLKLRFGRPRGSSASVPIYVPEEGSLS